MPQLQPFMTDARGRRFACSAVAVQAIIVNVEERLLLLSSPTRNRPGEWQVISGSLEAAETVLDGVLREAREEAGPQMQVRPLGRGRVRVVSSALRPPHPSPLPQRGRGSPEDCIARRRKLGTCAQMK